MDIRHPVSPFAPVNSNGAAASPGALLQAMSMDDKVPSFITDGLRLRMHFRNAARQTAQSLTRRYPFLRRLSLTTILFILVWFIAVYWGERSTSASHIEVCQWKRWEQWPAHAKPHHLVLIADPQLVDPHTYPGRPWPLSSLTEIYTDMYMARNFRLINQNLDPDSIVLLGDLFDGGREWATETPRPLSNDSRKLLEAFGLIPENGRERERTKFVQGEKGRWAKWGDSQWKADLARFTRIFFLPKQLYPKHDRELLSDRDTSTHPVSVENGAALVTTQEYSVTGGKQRNIIVSLPGNHDLGFASGIQTVVRERFETHFGATNSIYVLGNHTFVGVDTPSLSAFDEYVLNGDMTEARRAKYQHIWKPTSEFLDGLDKTAPKVVGDHLNQYYPGSHPRNGRWHEAVDIHDKSHVVPTKVNAGSQSAQLPIILLSHVPLYRNPDTECGPRREKGKAISITRGYQYQNVLTPMTSQMIAKKVSTVGNIEYIFSGDDHDYCDVTHRFNVGRWDEETGKDNVVMRAMKDITVKSFSWAMGVRKPGFQLVSLWNPVDEKGNTLGEPLPTVNTTMCLLPDQLSVFISYAQLLAFTLIILLVRAFIVGLRNKATPDAEEISDGLPRLSLPRYQDRVKMNGKANGYVSPKKPNDDTKGRQRASSTSTSTSSGNNNNLGVQRSYNARTRSVSPAPTSGGIYHSPNSSHYALPTLPQGGGPLIDKAGYYPQLRWQDPEESDEESHVGDDYQDSQAKWKKTKRSPSKARRVLNEFVISLTFVATPAGLFYGYLIKNG